MSWELGGSSRLQGPGPHGSEDEGKGLGSRLDIQQGHPLVLVATLPAMYHLGVSHVREQLLLGLVQLLSRVIAVHREQVMAKPVYPGEHGTGSAPGVRRHLTAPSLLLLAGALSVGAFWGTLEL